MAYDVVIHNGVIVTVNDGFEIIEKGFIGISGDRIAAIGTGETQQVPEGNQVIDAEGGIVLPGLVNTHNHLPMTLFRGLADDLPLMEWLNDHMFPVEARIISAETSRLGALLGCAEMILSGTTTCCDGYFFEDAVAKAFLETGMRGVLGQGVIDYPAPGVGDPADNVAYARRFVEKWSGVSPMISPSICCHSIYTCSKETLVKSKEAANGCNALFQVHAAETRSERQQCESDHAVSPVKLLKDLNILDPDTLLAHCVWTDDEDIAAIAQSGAAVSVNTESNMKLASGIAPVKKFLEAGITVGLGTDGCASNNDLDLFSEMDMTAKLHKVHHMDPTVLPASTVLKMATIGGARALGLGDHIGSIEIDKQADIIVIDTGKPHLTPMYNPVSHVVYTASGSDVKDVVIAGKPVLANSHLLTVDLDHIMKNVNDLAKTIRE
jgi:5-methylthioadenosine/S-adenosylhomocysteine deaminase